MYNCCHRFVFFFSFSFVKVVVSDHSLYCVISDKDFNSYDLIEVALPCYKANDQR